MASLLVILSVSHQLQGQTCGNPTETQTAINTQIPALQACNWVRQTTLLLVPE